jgi:subtilase family serine protease
MKKFLTLFFCIALSAALHAHAVPVANNTPGFIKKATDLGPLDPNSVINVTVWLQLHNEGKLDALVKEQKQKGSANYHKWITQDQFNASFAPTAKELDSVQKFLTSRGLSVQAVAENNMYIKVQGSVGDIEKAFHVQIDQYKFNGKTYRGNKGNPSTDDIPGARIAAITGLDDFGFEPTFARPTEADGKPIPFTPLSKVAPGGLFFEGHAFRPPQTHTFTDATDTATYSGNRYGSDITNTTLGHLPPQGYSPDEVQTAYGLNPLHSAGLNGTGETIVIVDAYGSATIAQDAAFFAQLYDLPPINLQIVKAPGLVHNPHGPPRNWAIETTLDVEWSHVVAPGANIALVVATDRASLDEAINYAVIHHLGNTISNSWSSIEGLGNPAQLGRVERILQMAAAQGIDVNFSTGDFGDETVRVGFLSVDYPASSPNATGIGGTSLALNNNNSRKFETGWGTNLTRIADISPSGGTVPDDNPPVVPPLNDPALGLGFQFGAGGGTSLTFAKPAFQSGLPGTKRLVPDISMLADPFTGVEIIQTIDGQLSVGTIGGTSLACPMFSGVMAIAAQKAGHGLGQAAALVYDLPAGAVLDIVPVGSASNPTGVIDGNPFSADDLAQPLENTTTYYSALYNSPFSTRWFVITFGTDSSLTVEPGWDNVTGVGVPNGANFINAIAQ